MTRDFSELLTNPVNKIPVQDQVIYQGSSQKELAANRLLMKTLALNADQLTDYLEELILDNPFIEMEYPPISNVQTAHRHEGHDHADAISQTVQVTNQSLTNYLFEQIMLYRQTAIRDIMIRLVDELDNRGYLPYNYTELSQKFNLDSMTILDGMTLLKQLEPAGVGAFDLRECLMLQTEQDELAPHMAYYLLESYFDALSKKDYAFILEQEEITPAELEECINYYHSLVAAPAELFENGTANNLVADIKVIQEGESVAIQLNAQAVPKLIFNEGYFQEMLAQDDPALLDYCLKHQRNYQIYQDVLKTRQTLMMAVAYQVVYFQKQYFKGNLTDKAPLSIRMVARQLQIPESIVSQVVNNKYLLNKDQVYPMTDYFNMANHVGRSRLTASSIKKMVVSLMRENPELSDSQVAEKLEEQKVIVSPGIVQNFRQSAK